MAITKVSRNLLNTGVSDSSDATAITIDSSENVTVNTGNLVIGTAGKGIDFSITSDASGMTSELLDDYEEGTWTPTYSSTGLSSTHDIQNGHYTKIGNMVYFGLLVGTDAVSGGSTNQLKIIGLPYSSVNSTTKLSSGAVGLSYLFTSGQNNMKWFIGANSSEISFYIGNDNNVASVQPSSVLNNGANQNRLYITGFYVTA